MRAIFAVLAGVVGLGAAVGLLSLALQSTGRFSSEEIGVAIVGGLTAIVLVGFAVRTAMMDTGFRARLKSLRIPK